MLKPGASPTIYECFPEHLHPTLSKRKAPASRHLPSPKRRDPEDPPTTSSGDTAVSHFGTDADFSDMNSDDADLPHEHCQCVQDLQESIKTLRSELSASLLKSNQLMQQLQQEKNRKDFSLDRFKNDDKKIRFYTGFVSFGMFLACFDFLLASAKQMRTWQGKRTSMDERTTEKPGPKPKLSHLDQFFLTMVRLRLGLSVEDLADRFGINPSTVSKTFITWINLMYVKFKELPMWMSQSQVNRWMPPYFKKWYPTTRVIIDATEFFIEKPSSLARQSATWSSYKNHNTFKVLIGISPDGTMVFISNLYEGSVSDVDLVSQSGLLALLERDDSIMADKGFDIQHLLGTIGVRLNIPPFRRGNQQMTPDEVLKTKKIAAVRIHVERAINRLKQYSLVSGVIPNTLWDIADQIIFVAGYLTNFEPGLTA